MKTINEQGLFNNYATEPALYYAEFPSEYQQRQYLWQGAVATLVVATLLFTAISVA
uniref:Ssl1498 family light-harvesting-like protein n=1 Tax=Oscillatoriales cyanobacterium SpSt-402 TaxID=2282168 RepID=A0A832GZJ1_9CYAN